MAIENVDNTAGLQKLKDDNLAAMGDDVLGAEDADGNTPPAAAVAMADGFADAAAAYIDDVVLTQANDERVRLLDEQNTARQEALDAAKSELQDLIDALTDRVSTLEEKVATLESSSSSMSSHTHGTANLPPVL
jgi:hypothetical protein